VTPTLTGPALRLSPVGALLRPGGPLGFGLSPSLQPGGRTLIAYALATAFTSATASFFML
jgi:hypothetical protein